MVGGTRFVGQSKIEYVIARSCVCVYVPIECQDGECWSVLSMICSRNRWCASGNAGVHHVTKAFENAHRPMPFQPNNTDQEKDISTRRVKYDNTFARMAIDEGWYMQEIWEVKRTSVQKQEKTNSKSWLQVSVLHPSIINSCWIGGTRVFHDRLRHFHFCYQAISPMADICHIGQFHRSRYHPWQHHCHTKPQHIVLSVPLFWSERWPILE